MLIYTAGPITGLSYDTSTNWRDNLKKILPKNIQIISPMRGKDYLKESKKIEAWDENDPLRSKKGIVTRDRFDVSRCDLFFANLSTSSKISIGTMVEFGWADFKRKPIITLLKKDDIIYQHPFIYELSSFIVHDLNTAAEIIKNFL